MAKYKITFKKSVAKDFKSIPRSDLKKILTKIDMLGDNPRMEGSVKLSGQNYYRVRQGFYRIVYEIRDQQLVVLVIKVGHRSDVYRNK